MIDTVIAVRGGRIRLAFRRIVAEGVQHFDVRPPPAAMAASFVVAEAPRLAAFADAYAGRIQVFTSQTTADRLPDDYGRA